MRLSRVMRMKSRAEFSRVREEGSSFGGRYLVLGYLPEPDLAINFKFGIILTRKVGNAVKRNRIRRRVRAVVEELGGGFAQPSSEAHGPRLVDVGAAR